MDATQDTYRTIGENDLFADFFHALTEHTDLPFDWDGPMDLAVKLQAFLDAKDAELSRMRSALQTCVKDLEMSGDPILQRAYDQAVAALAPPK